ncbi:hypothetical protein PCANC_17937 [Puccinia coronata f. sp. avenae]|uniref:CCHC-type domain-containing protein n=1 Tax=Puccinia coronata f. sp. avenae TaxID=200324 RepID=A0A2N5SQ90_9BASI|nr:hypothetical protein PCANC_17937 [Puccinia coronata f. sp. avenae]
MDSNNSNPTRAENGNSRLPQFDGKSEPKIWLLKIESVLEGRNCPQDRWTLLIAECMKGTAESWWFQLAREEGTNKLEWGVFKRRFLQRFNYLYEQVDIRQKLDEIKYRNVDQYVDKFSRLILKLHRDKITDWETSYLFCRNLPPLLKQQVMTEKCDSLEELCASLRENDQILQSSSNHAGGHRSGPLPFISFKKNPSYGNYGSQNTNHHRPSFGGHSCQNSTSQAIPMDLDAVDVSKARCYNCNKTGHLSKDCSAPRKIKFGNFPKNGNSHGKQSLNLIDLDIPQGSDQGPKDTLFTMEVLKEGAAQQYVKTRLEFIANKIDKCLEDSLNKLSHGHLLNPKALEFLPGARKHGITQELRLN